MPPRSVRIAKRAIDIVASSVGLAVALLIGLPIALAIWLDSPGPIFFKQPRAGALLPSDGPGTAPRCVSFLMYKFRTMRVDAERFTGAVLAAEGDPRVTRVGRILRKTHLDELPQLWNVLLGDMSLVGPRPERAELLADLALAIPFFEERLRDLKPGLTGLAQISLEYTGAIPRDSELWPYRDSLQNPYQLEEAAGALADDMRAKLLYDLAYSAALQRLGTYLATELRIILMTPWAMLRGNSR
jgi:lipopolysaccharide/colanic/teichoic acid biosynthesis glycosyltransferase